MQASAGRKGDRWREVRRTVDCAVAAVAAEEENCCNQSWIAHSNSIIIRSCVVDRRVEDSVSLFVLRLFEFEYSNTFDRNKIVIALSWTRRLIACMIQAQTNELKSVPLEKVFNSLNWKSTPGAVARNSTPV